MEFRAEMFNMTNTPAFAQPNGSFGAAAFGSITSDDDRSAGGAVGDSDQPVI